MEKFILFDKNFKKSRLPSLYSDFSHLQQTNIEGYTANLTSWKFLLLNIINNHNELLCQDDVISFDSSTLVDQLTVRDATLTYKPKGLPEVLNSMINEDHTLIPLSLFKAKPVDTTGKGDGIFRSIFQPLIGTSYCNHVTNFNTADPSSFEGGLISNEKFLSLSKLKSTADTIRSIIADNNPIKLGHLKQLAQNNTILKTQTDFNCCITYLSRDAMVIGLNEDIAYLLPPGGNEKEKDVSGLDLTTLKTVADLNYSIFQLQNHYDTLYSTLSVLDNKVHQLIKGKRLKLAKSQLRIKKIVEKQLVENQLKLENLQIIQLKLNEAQTNVGIAETLKTNASLLKKINKEVPEAVELDSILQDMGEELEQTTEISDRLGKLTFAATQEDDKNIETELDVLEKEEAKKQDESPHQEQPTKNEQAKSGSSKNERMVVLEGEQFKDGSCNSPTLEPKSQCKSNSEQIGDLEKRFRKLTLPKEKVSEVKNSSAKDSDREPEQLTA